MKFLDYLFHGKELRYIDSYFKMLNGYSPTFTSYNGGVYEMDLTRTAVNSFATHCSKLKPEIEGSALKSLEKTLQHKPNYFMDTTKFIKRLATYVAVEHTAFIIPIEDEYGRLCGWYPLRAQRCEVVEAAGQVYLRYLFANGEHGAIEFERVGIMTDFEYTDDLFGEDNRTLKPTMQLIHTQNEGIINAVKNSANIRFLAKVANMLKPEDIKKERQRFTEDNLSADNDSGMIIYDNKFSELKQVESKPYTPNALQMQNIQENVCTHFGTNMDILQNKFDENALDEVQEKFGGYDKLSEVFNKDNPNLFKDTRWLLTLLINEALLAEDENAQMLDEKKVGRLIHAGNLQEVQSAIFKSFAQGTAGDEEAQEEDKDETGTTEEGNSQAVQES